MKSAFPARVLLPLMFLPLILTFCFYSLVFRSNQWTVFYGSYTIACLITFIALYLILKSNGMTLSDLGFNGFKWSYIGWGVLFFGIAGVWCTGIALLLKYGFGLSKEWLLKIHFTQPFDPYIMLLAVVVIGPITEESLFRGFFMTWAKEKYPLWIAGFLSSLLFGLYYYYFTGLTGALLIFFWTPLPLILFLRHKSIYPGIVLHMVNNLFPYVIVKLLSDMAFVQTLTKIGIL